MAASVIYAYDSFKSGTTIADILNARWTSKLTNGGSTVAYAATGGRFGGQSIHMTNMGQLTCLQKGGLANLATLCLHMPVTVGLIDTVASVLGGFMDGSNTQISLRLNPTGTLSVMRGYANGTVLGTSSFVMAANVYYVIEIKVTFSTTVGVIEVRVNGVTVIGPTSSLNTSNSTNAFANGYFVGNSATTGSGAQANNNCNADFEHAVLLDDFVGDKRFYTRLPNSDSSVQWTKNGGATNFSRVSEAQQDGDTTYNSDSTPGHIDLFGLPATPANTANIFAVMMSIWARKDDAGVRSVCNQMSSGGTVANGATDTLSTSFAEFIDILYNDPNTSAAWTKTNLDAALQGYKEVA